MSILPNPTIHTATFKACPSDFIVTEQLDIDFDGQGEHLWVYVEKIGMNSAFVARPLSKWAGIGVRDVGYSGLKDRHAKTYQWFSLRLPNRQPPAENFADFIKEHLQDGESIHIQKSAWHGRKLNRGTHQANHFIITLKDITDDKHAIESQLAHIAQHGVPNYFGEQRFGRNGQNLETARLFFEKLLASPKPYKPHKKDLEKHSLLISAVRSHLFNEILALRVLDGSWDAPITGDVFNLDGTGSIFSAPIDDEIVTRLDTHDIHPTIALYGIGENKATDDALSLENRIFMDKKYHTLTQGLLKVNAKMLRRATRLIPQNLAWQWLNDTSLKLDFSLPKGAFATVLLDVLVEQLCEPDKRG